MQALEASFDRLPATLGAADLQQLIQQYSWNVEKHPLLLEAALSAGLYPNFAFGSLSTRAVKLLEGLGPAGLGLEPVDDKKDSQVADMWMPVEWRGAEDGQCYVHPSSLLAKQVPKFRCAGILTLTWTAF